MIPGSNSILVKTTDQEGRVVLLVNPSPTTVAATTTPLPSNASAISTCATVTNLTAPNRVIAPVLGNCAVSNQVCTQYFCQELNVNGKLQRVLVPLSQAANSTNPHSSVLNNPTGNVQLKIAENTKVTGSDDAIQIAPSLSQGLITSTASCLGNLKTIDPGTVEKVDQRCQGLTQIISTKPSTITKTSNSIFSTAAHQTTGLSTEATKGHTIPRCEIPKYIIKVDHGYSRCEGQTTRTDSAQKNSSFSTTAKGGNNFGTVRQAISMLNRSRNTSEQVTEVKNSASSTLRHLTTLLPFSANSDHHHVAATPTFSTSDPDSSNEFKRVAVQPVLSSCPITCNGQAYQGLNATTSNWGMVSNVSLIRPAIQNSSTYVTNSSCKPLPAFSSLNSSKEISDVSRQSADTSLQERAVSVDSLSSAKKISDSNALPSLKIDSVFSLARSATHISASVNGKRADLTQKATSFVNNDDSTLTVPTREESRFIESNSEADGMDDTSYVTEDVDTDFPVSEVAVRENDEVSELVAVVECRVLLRNISRELQRTETRNIRKRPWSKIFRERLTSYYRSDRGTCTHLLLSKRYKLNTESPLTVIECEPTESAREVSALSFPELRRKCAASNLKDHAGDYDRNPPRTSIWAGRGRRPVMKNGVLKVKRFKTKKRCRDSIRSEETSMAGKQFKNGGPIDPKYPRLAPGMWSEDVTSAVSSVCSSKETYTGNKPGLKSLLQTVDKDSQMKISSYGQSKCASFSTPHVASSVLAKYSTAGSTTSTASVHSFGSVSMPAGHVGEKTTCQEKSNGGPSRSFSLGPCVTAGFASSRNIPSLKNCNQNDHNDGSFLVLKTSTNLYFVPVGKNAFVMPIPESRSAPSQVDKSTSAESVEKLATALHVVETNPRQPKSSGTEENSFPSPLHSNPQDVSSLTPRKGCDHVKVKTEPVTYGYPGDPGTDAGCTDGEIDMSDTHHEETDASHAKAAKPVTFRSLTELYRDTLKMPASVVEKSWKNDNVAGEREERIRLLKERLKTKTKTVEKAREKRCTDRDAEKLIKEFDDI